MRYDEAVSEMGRYFEGRRSRAVNRAPSRAAQNVPPWSRATASQVFSPISVL